MKRIAIAIGDAATGDLIVPVLPLLDREGIKYQIFVDPGRKAAGATALRKQGITYVEAEGIPDVAFYDLLVCGTAMKSQTLVRNVTVTALVTGMKVVWAGDFYGSGCEKSMLDLAPDYLTALDQTAVDWIRRVRPTYPTERIRMVGNPSWDRLSNLMAMRMGFRDKIFAELKLPTGTKLIVFSCSDTGQFDDKEMVSTIEAMTEYAHSRGSVVVFLFHPADQRKDFWGGRIEELPDFMIVRDRLTGDPLADLLVADAAVVQYSQLGCQSSLAVPTLFTLLPSMRKYQRESRGATWGDRFFPQILHHAAEVAWGVREIAPALDRMLGDEPGYHEALEEARRKHFSTLMDGHAAERFMDLVRERLNYREGQECKWLGGRP